MRKKIIIALAIFLVTISIFFVFNTGNQPKRLFSNTIPLLNKSSSRENSDIIPTKKYPSPVNIRTDISHILDSSESASATEESDKLSEILPYFVESFKTSVGIITTITIEIKEYDPPSLIRFNVYGINYSERDTKDIQATAFKESFLEAKKYLAQYKVNLKNLNIVYSDYQYAQDTASYWVKEFKLLD